MEENLKISNAHIIEFIDRYAIDATKLKNEFGWEPKTKFDNGIILTIDWYLTHSEYLINLVSPSLRLYLYNEF